MRSSQRWFLFRELVRRDFTKKYHRSVLGIVWSLLLPVFTLLIMRAVFTHQMGRDTPHYTTYLFSGIILLNYFCAATRAGMTSFVQNRNEIEKIRLPKLMLLFSRNAANFLDFLMVFCVFLLLCALDRIAFGWHMLALVYPIVCLAAICVGAGMALAVVFVYFRDVGHIYDVFLTLLRYASAVFYSVDSLPAERRRLFLCNPLYVAIRYFRDVIIDRRIPSPRYHLLLGGYALGALVLGALVYRWKKDRLVYHF